MLRLSGEVATGRGEASGFTRIDWVRTQCVERLGIDPFPGTLNLLVTDELDRQTWVAVANGPGIRLDPPDGASCGARCYPVTILGRLPGAAVRPDVDDYPVAQVEVIAAVSIRDVLSLGDGHRVDLDVREPLRVRAVLFDVDGTLLDAMAAFRVVAQRAAAPYGLAITEDAVRQALNTNCPFWDLVLAPDHPERATLTRDLVRTARDLWPGVLAEHGRVFPAVPALLDTLRDRGARLGIVTGGHGSSLVPISELGLLDRFEAIVTGRDVKRPKPDPEGLLKAAAALDVDPAEMAYVGDTPMDVGAARAAGMFAVGLLSGAGDSALLSAAGADRIVASHDRLPELFEVLQ